MKIKHEIECWREIVDGRHPRADELEVAERDAIAGVLLESVLDELFAAGIDCQRAYGQRVGAFEIVQQATDAERVAFDSVVERCVSNWK